MRIDPGQAAFFANELVHESNEAVAQAAGKCLAQFDRGLPAAPPDGPALPPEFELAGYALYAESGEVQAGAMRKLLDTAPEQHELLSALLVAGTGSRHPEMRSCCIEALFARCHVWSPDSELPERLRAQILRDEDDLDVRLGIRWLRRPART